MELRDYQQQCVDDIRKEMRVGKRAPLLVLPTGGGKTTIFAYIAKSAADKDKTVWIIAHRSELVQQISATLSRFGAVHNVIAQSNIITRIKCDQFREYERLYFNTAAKISVCSAQTLVNRLATMNDAPDLIIIDEAHHLTKGTTWGKIIDAYPDAKLLPVTATPCRLDGKGLTDYADSMVLGPTMRQLIDAEYLSPYRIFAPPQKADISGVKKVGGDFVKNKLAEAMDRPVITGDAVDHYTRLANGKRAVVFCVSVAHAGNVRDEFLARGITAETLDGTMSPEDRSATLARFSSGQTLILCTCDIVSEGFDLPAIEVAILLRPTASLSLYLQQIGRALRIFAGKYCAIILDHVGNVSRHGLPDEDREWSLDGVKKRPRNADGNAAGIRTCPMCFAMHKPAFKCPQCGHEYSAKERASMEVVEGELVELTPAQMQIQKKRESMAKKKDEWDCKTVEELTELGRSRGYHYPKEWAERKFSFRKKSA